MKVKPEIHLPIFFIWLGLVLSCSTKRATYVNKGYHALTSNYNILFNGKEALKKGEKELEDKVKSDFYKEIPLEGIEFDDQVTLPGQSRSNFLSKAEEKAAKAVQKHSMEIRGVEYNPKMDEAMLLLGQARYYDQRYFGAMEAFNYALDNYFDTGLREQLILWRAKTLMRMGNIHSARRELHLIATNKKYDQNTRALAYAFMSETLRSDTLRDTVAILISRAARLAKKRAIKIKLAYKAAQVWEKLGKPDSALAISEIIMQKRTPEEYYLRTKWYRIHLQLNDTSKHEDFLKKLNAYFKNYYFHRYYPDIHYRIGEIYEFEQKDSAALSEYTAAVRSPNKSLKKLAYEKMAAIHWNNSDYLTAGHYLDSLLNVMDKNTLEYLLVSQKRRSIDQIVKWESIIKTNDSILHFIRLDTTTQRQKVLAMIERLKAREAGKNKAENPFQPHNKPQGTFYFYNPNQVENGKKTFIEKWGNRKLEDLWFLSNKYGEAGEEEEISETEPDKEKQEEKKNNKIPDKYNPDFYLNRLPKTPLQIDSIKQQTLQAHLYLGINYADDKLKEYDMAEKHLQFVLNHHPSSDQEAQTLYMLQKIAAKTHQTEKQNTYKELLLQKFPDSPYARFLKNPEAGLADSSESFKQDFLKTYNDFLNGHWALAETEAEKFYQKHFKHPDAPKFLLLKARIQGKRKGINAYVETLNLLIRNYPDSDYAEYAGKILKKLKTLQALYGRKEIPPKHPFYIVFKFRHDTSSIPRTRQCLRQVYDSLHAGTKHIFKDQFNENTYFLVTGDFLSPQSAEYVLDKFKQLSCTIPEHFIISRKNYINLQLTKGKETATIKIESNVQRQKEIKHDDRERFKTTQPPGRIHRPDRRH